VDRFRAKMALAPNAIGGNFRAWALRALPCLNQVTVTAQPTAELVQTALGGHGEFTEGAKVLDGAPHMGLRVQEGREAKGGCKVWGKGRGAHGKP
jgi:hypothetical protein